MSDTEQLFVVAAVWALIAAVVARFIANWPGRIAFFALAVGIPFWELPYGYYNFQKHCSEQGGLRVLEPIPPQKIVCVDYPYDSGAPGFLKAGFGNVEARDKKGSVSRVSRTPSGVFESAKQESVTSEYCISRAFIRGLPWRIMRNEMTVSRDKEQRMVARHSDFVWFGMWWQEAASPILGRGGECRHDAVGLVSAAVLRGMK